MNNKQFAITDGRGRFISNDIRYFANGILGLSSASVRIYDSRVVAEYALEQANAIRNRRGNTVLLKIVAVRPAVIVSDGIVR